ncbi:MAG: neutral zinc metallopeptidase [Chitinophagaceae bacterium]
MKWQGREESENIEDRRGVSGRQVAMGGGLFGIIILVVGLLLGGDPQQLFSDFFNQRQQTSSNTTATTSQEEENLKKFVSVVLKDNETIWTRIFSQNNMRYAQPTMVFFDDATQSPCGMASAQTGPFYCPADQKIYLSKYFFTELTQRLGAKGDFALAYVISHEVGHHIQHLLGTANKVRQAQSRVNEVQSNRYQVAMELQADFYAGVWAHYNQQINNALEEGDIEEAMSAANAVGDDRLQKRSQGYVNADAFTHGTSEQRMYWFMRGYKSGDLNQGNTFENM